MTRTPGVSSRASMAPWRVSRRLPRLRAEGDDGPFRVVQGGVGGVDLLAPRRRAPAGRSGRCALGERGGHARLRVMVMVTSSKGTVIGASGLWTHTSTSWTPSCFRQTLRDALGERLDEVDGLALDDGHDLLRHDAVVHGLRQVVVGRRRTGVQAERPGPRRRSGPLPAPAGTHRGAHGPSGRAARHDPRESLLQSSSGGRFGPRAVGPGSHFRIYPRALTVPAPRGPVHVMTRRVHRAFPGGNTAAHGLVAALTPCP